MTAIGYWYESIAFMVVSGLALCLFLKNAYANYVVLHGEDRPSATTIKKLRVPIVLTNLGIGLAITNVVQSVDFRASLGIYSVGTALLLGGNSSALILTMGAYYARSVLQAVSATFRLQGADVRTKFEIFRTGTVVLSVMLFIVCNVRAVYFLVENEAWIYSLWLFYLAVNVSLVILSFNWGAWRLFLVMRTVTKERLKLQRQIEKEDAKRAKEQQDIEEVGDDDMLNREERRAQRAATMVSVSVSVNTVKKNMDAPMQKAYQKLKLFGVAINIIAFLAVLGEISGGLNNLNTDPIRGPDEDSYSFFGEFSGLLFWVACLGSYVFLWLSWTDKTLYVNRSRHSKQMSEERSGGSHGRREHKPRSSGASARQAIAMRTTGTNSVDTTNSREAREEAMLALGNKTSSTDALSSDASRDGNENLLQLRNASEEDCPISDEDVLSRESVTGGLPPGWVVEISDDGVPYYLHESTGDRVWEKPSSDVQLEIHENGQT